VGREGRLYLRTAGSGDRPQAQHGSQQHVPDPLDPAITVCDYTGCDHTSDNGKMQLEIPAGAIPDGETVDVTDTLFEQVEYLPSGGLSEGTWET
jgi:hypothetical protein